jgi:hypothetical protein
MWTAIQFLARISAFIQAIFPENSYLGLCTFYAKDISLVGICRDKWGQYTWRELFQNFIVLVISQIQWLIMAGVNKGLIYIFFSNGSTAPLGALGLLIIEASRSHTQTHTLGRTPLDEWSAHRRDLYLTTHNTHKRQTSMPSAGFEPIPASERP